MTNPLTPEPPAELKRLAEVLHGDTMPIHDAYIDDKEWMAFHTLANPQTVLALIARIEADAVEKLQTEARLVSANASVAREIKNVVCLSAQIDELKDCVRSSNEELTRLRAQVKADAVKIARLKDHLEKSEAVVRGYELCEQRIATELRAQIAAQVGEIERLKRETYRYLHDIHN